MRVLIRALTPIVQLREVFENRNWRVEDGKTICDKYSLGWFMQLEGFRESVFVGFEKPADLEVGEQVCYIIQKSEPPCQPSTSTSPQPAPSSSSKQTAALERPEPS